MIAPDALAKALMLPLLLLQGASARRRAQSLPEPLGARLGEGGSGPPLSLLLAGDSSAAGVGATHQHEALSGRLAEALANSYRLSWRLEAKRGATTACTLKSLTEAAPAKFDVAVVALGVNDITSGVSLKQLLARRATLHALLRDRFGVKSIVVSGLPPIKNFPLLPHPLRWVLGQQTERFDRALTIQAGADNIDYIPFAIKFDPTLMAPDGFHPAPEAYRLWANLLARHIRPIPPHIRA